MKGNTTNKAKPLVAMPTHADIVSLQAVQGQISQSKNKIIATKWKITTLECQEAKD